MILAGVRLVEYEFNLKKNVILFSLEGKHFGLFKTFGGLYECPNIDRLAGISTTLTKMYTAAPSTAMSLSAVVNGRYNYEFDRADYTDESIFEDNLFSELSRRGKNNFLCLTDYLYPKHFFRIHDGTDVQLELIPRTNNVSVDIANKVVEIANNCSGEYFILAHAAPYSLGRETDLPNWKTGMQRAVWQDDRAVGILLDNIDLTNTSIVLYSDHGLLSGEHHHLFQHAYFLYEQLVHVPCLITSEQPARIDTLHSLIQLYDVVLQNKLRPLEQVFFDTQFACQLHRISGIRYEQFKYIAHYNWMTSVTGLQEELYDIETDPGEARNLLRNVARHPLRFEWTRDDMSAFEKIHAYNETYLKEVLPVMRRVMADIWSSGLLAHLAKRDSHVWQEANKLFSGASDLQKLYLVGNFVEKLFPKTRGYGRLDRALNTDQDYHLEFFPELPKQRSNTHFSDLLDPQGLT